MEDPPLSSLFWLAQAHAEPIGGDSATALAFKLAAVIGLVLINGFFVATEFSLVGVRMTRIDELVRRGVRGAASVKFAKEHLDEFVASTQLGITMSSLALGWIGEPTVAHMLEPLFSFLNQWAATASHVVSLVLGFALVTTVHIVAGEQVPKLMAIQRSEAVSLWTATPVSMFRKIFIIFIRMLARLTRTAMKALGLKGGGHHEGHSIYSEEEIRHILTLRTQAGEADPAENEMIGRVFSFFDLVATQIMVPRTEMLCVPDTATVGEVVEVSSREPHDRYPVYHENLDDIVGVVMTRDLVAALNRGGEQAAPVTGLMKPVQSVPGSLPVSQLMAKMKSERTRLLIVLDEYGGTAGMVTLGDLLERIVGEVEEHDTPPEESDILEQPDGTLLISGLLLTEDVAAQLGSEIKDEHNDTIGGVVFSLIGRKPEVGDEVRVNGHIFRVEALDGLRIDRLSVRKSEEEAGQPV